MSEKVKNNAASIAAEPATPQLLPVSPFPEIPPAPSTTHYTELANTLLAALDQFSAAMPHLPEAAVTKAFVRRKRGVPAVFRDGALSAAIIHPELQGIKALELTQTIDDRQHNEAMRPVARRLGEIGKSLNFEIDARDARVAAAAQQIYGVAKVFVRDRENATLGIHVDDLQRVLRAARRPARKAVAETPAPAGKEGTAIVQGSSSKQ
jgi:hypothetical protein